MIKFVKRYHYLFIDPSVDNLTNLTSFRQELERELTTIDASPDLVVFTGQLMLPKHYVILGQVLQKKGFKRDVKLFLDLTSVKEAIQEFQQNLGN